MAAAKTPSPDDAPGDVAEIEPPYMKTSKFGYLSDLYRTWAYRRKLRRYAGNGYVLWERVDDARTGPKLVKPEHQGAGIPELKYDGERYLFPERARVPDKRTGLWFYRHEANDAVPINLRSPDEVALSPGVLQRYSDLKPETDEPGFFDSLNLDPQDLVMYGVLGIGAIAMAAQLLGGGI